MLNTIVKWTALAACLALLPMSWWLPTASGTLMLRLAVWAGIVVFVIQAAAARRYGWAVGFMVLGVVFNPVFPVPLSASVFLALNACCAAAMAASLWLAPQKPRLTIASITGAPRSASL